MNFFSAEGLRIQRMQKRVSQAELAAKVGLSTATICRIEKGDKVPTAEEFKILSDALLAMPVKPWATTESDATPDLRLLRGEQRLRVEISLEDLGNTKPPSSAQRDNVSAKAARQARGASFVFYVPLDGLAVQLSSEYDVHEELNEYPRQR